MDQRQPFLTFFFGATSFVALLAALWLAARYFHVAETTGGSQATAITSLALILAPYWAFGFGAAEPLRRVLAWRPARVLAPGLLTTSYLVFSVPRGEFHWQYAVVLFALPVAVAELLDSVAPDTPLVWQDVIALLLLGVPVVLRWLNGAWPHPALSALPKLLLTDAALYGYLVVRRRPGVGFDLRPRARDLAIGFREWLLFAPFGIGLGLALGFIHAHAVLPSGWRLLAASLSTFLLIALPEELFFRGILLNLLEPRLGRRGAVLVSAIFFGLSHFNKRAVFNWRYVLLATIAGVFYARAWLDRRRLFTSAVTHTAVDVVWGAWFW